jgi:hypothetical protein
MTPIGTVLSAPDGPRVVVEVEGAHEYIARVTDGANYRSSFAEQCAMWGGRKHDRPKQWTAAQRAARQEPIR